MSVHFDARAMLERSLQVTDHGQHDIGELHLICRLFRFPISAKRNIEAEPFPMPGAYRWSLNQENNMGSGHLAQAFSKMIIGLTIGVFGMLSSNSKEIMERSGGPINRLNKDILKKIFVLAYNDDLLLQGPLTLINVSRQWRTVAFTIPSLWAVLNIKADVNLFNPFYSIIYYAFHAHDLCVWVRSPAVLASVTTLAAVIPPRIRSTLHVPQLRSLSLVGSGAIETIDAFPLYYPNLTRLALMDLRRLFPINLLSNCPALEMLVMNCCVEALHQKFVNEELLLCGNITCTALHTEWNAKWVPFEAYADNLPIFLLNSLIFSLSDTTGFKKPPLSLLLKNPDIECLTLQGVSLNYGTDVQLIRPLMDLSLLSRLELSDVDSATILFQLCVEFPSTYFPRLVSLRLTNVTLSADSLMDYIRMKTELTIIPVNVSPLQDVWLKGILLEEGHLSELELMRRLRGIVVNISL